MFEPKDKAYPPPRVMVWTCRRCGSTWATEIKRLDYVKRPDAVGTTICDKCIEKMGAKP